MFDHGAKGRLTERDLPRFAGETLFARVGRSVCSAGCLPRKELYEAWEVARRARRLFRGGRIVDVGAGHGLLAHLMLLLDDSSPTAVCVDPVRPPCADRVQDALQATWPRLAGRVTASATSVEAFALEAGDIVVSSHACGALTDRVLDRATRARARVAVLPCCHDARTCDPGPLRGWVDLGLAVDVRRALRLEQLGYRVWTQRIPETITPKNRLLLGAPPV